MKLTNNTILITGGTSGIGYELGQALLKMNNEVILLRRDKNQLAEAEAEGFRTLRCDLSNPADIENAVVDIQNRFPPVNMLFNNAGVQYNYAFTQDITPPQRIVQEIAVNLTGQIMLTQLLIPLLSTAQRALIVNTTSGLGAFPKPDGLVYSASKAGLRNFTVGLRYALKSSPINVLEFIPPVTDTRMTAGRSEPKMSAQKLAEYVLPQITKERTIVTTPKMRLFLWIAFLFPALAHRILSKK